MPQCFAAASTRHSGHRHFVASIRHSGQRHLLLEPSSLPFASIASLPFAGLPTPKTSTIFHGNFHQAFVVRALQPAVCLHSPLLLGRSSLPFASLKAPKTLKTFKIPRDCFHQAFRPQAFVVRALQPLPSVVSAFKPAVCQR